MGMFLVLGITGLALLVLGFFLDGVLDMFDFEFGDGFLSLTSLSAFVASFGFAGVVAISQFDATVGIAILVGLAVGALAFLAAGGLTRYLRTEHGEGAPSSRTIVGVQGTIVTPVPSPGAYGEVSLNHGGHLVKMGAIADEVLPMGTTVEVVAALSSTSVRVVRVAQ